MVNYQYSYLIADLVLLVIWFVLFFWRKDVRKEMLYISIIFGFVGLLVEPIFLKDWWNPLTITTTMIGFEDFLFGFTFAGIASVIYSVIFKKRVRIKKVNKKKEFKRNKNYLILSAFLVGLFFSSFYILKLNSFYSSIIAFIIPLTIIWIKRKDLIINSITSGLLLMIIVCIWFWIPELITPEWINTHWFLENLSGITILKVPLEDLIWSFLAGAFIGPLYEYWQEGKLINKK